MNPLLASIHEGYRQSQKSFAILIDPDQGDADMTIRLIAKANANKVDFLFVGGSLIQDDNIQRLVPMIKNLSDIPVVLFPGSIYQISPEADGILFLSLISGRNPDLLIGKQVEAAPLVKQSGLNVLPTGYMLIDTGKPTTASYMSATPPIPYDKPAIASCTAMAGELLGMQLIYMDGGSGAQKPISPEMVHTVRKHIDIPIIVGGGIRNAHTAHDLWKAGADILVIGNALEKEPDSQLMKEIADCRDSFSTFTQKLRS